MNFFIFFCTKKYKIIVISNHAGIGIGYYTEKDFFKRKKNMKLLLEKKLDYLLIHIFQLQKLNGS